MTPDEVPDELVDLAMTGANPGCRDDARFYLANVLPKIRADERAKVAEEIEAVRKPIRGSAMPDFADAAYVHAARIARGDQ